MLGKSLLVLAVVACSGVLRNDPLPTRRPPAPYLCVRNSGPGNIIVRVSDIGARFMTVQVTETICRTLPYLREVYVGFEGTVGLQSKPVHWTPIPLLPQSESQIKCWFVNVTTPALAIGAIRPCIDRT